MQAIIETALRGLEHDKGIKILYAAEAGSRAWGFPSRDSDYDIRLIYVKPLADYVKVFPDKDNFEQALVFERGGVKEVLDIAGWELTKALGLAAKCNAPLVEWLTSPTIYRGNSDFVAQMLNFHYEFFDRRGLLYHYTNLAARTISEHLATTHVKAKKYFYAIRPILGAHYIVEKSAAPPVDFLELLKVSPIKDRAINEMVLELYAKKIGGSSESDRVSVSPELLDWLQAQITYLRGIIPTLPVRDMRPQSSFDALDAFLYRMVMLHEKRIGGLADST